MTNAKEFLSSWERCRIFIEQRQEQRRELLKFATWPYPVAKKCERMAKEVDQIIRRDTVTQNNILSMIQEMDNPIYRDFLILRYVKKKTLLQIAQGMSYSEDYIKKLHKAALSAFEKQYGSRINSESVTKTS